MGYSTSTYGLTEIVGVWWNHGVRIKLCLTEGGLNLIEQEVEVASAAAKNHTAEDEYCFLTQISS